MPKPGFLTLPREIRQMIYALVLGAGTPAPSMPPPPGEESWTHEDLGIVVYEPAMLCDISSASLLRTNKEIRAEMLACIQTLQSRQKLVYKAVLFLESERYLHPMWTSMPAVAAYIDRVEVDLLIRGQHPPAKPHLEIRRWMEKASMFAGQGSDSPPVVDRIWDVLAVGSFRAGELRVNIPDIPTDLLPDGVELLAMESFNDLRNRSRCRPAVINPLTVATELAAYTGWLFEARNYHPDEYKRGWWDIPERLGWKLICKYDRMRISTDAGLVREWDLVPVRKDVEVLRGSGLKN